MEKFSKFIKKCGFTFSLKRLKRAIILVILFLGIGFGVHFIYEFGNSESGLKMIYEKEIASKIAMLQSVDQKEEGVNYGRR